MKKSIRFILCVIIAFNITFFSQCIVADKTYTHPRTMLLSISRGVNQLYLFPAAQLFGINSILVVPFSTIRNIAYKYGISDYLPDEIDKEIWWGLIYFSEYKNFYTPYLKESLHNLSFKSDAAIHLAKLDELYAHLKSYSSTSHLRNKEFENKVIQLYETESLEYIKNKEDAFSYASVGHDFFYNSELKFTKSFLKDKDSMSEIYNLERILRYLKSKYPPSQNSSLDIFLSYESSVLILASKISNQDFQCSDDRIKYIADASSYFKNSHFENIRYAVAFKKNISQKEAENFLYSKWYAIALNEEQNRLVSEYISKSCQF